MRIQQVVGHPSRLVSRPPVSPSSPSSHLDSMIVEFGYKYEGIFLWLSQAYRGVIRVYSGLVTEQTFSSMRWIPLSLGSLLNGYNGYSGGDLQPGRLADRFVAGHSQPEINP
eukprot:62470-Pelagomonas_calceolata.AAC.1